MTEGRRQILYVSPCWPHGPAYGGQLRALHIGRALRQIGDVTLAVVSPDPPTAEIVRDSRAEFKLAPQVLVELCPNRTLRQRWRRAWDREYLNVHGCVADPAGRARLLSSVGQFDLVWVLNSRTPNILQRWRWPRAVLDLDDVPSTYQRTLWQNGRNWLERIKAGAWMLLLRRREQLWPTRFAALSVCSEADRAYLGGGEHIHVIPNGFERPAELLTRHPVTPPRVGFVGLFSYQPNLEGVRWFVRACWPLIQQAIPHVRLRLMGTDTDGPLPPKAPNIDGLGWVADPAAEMATWSLMVIPVRHGAGTRIKLADAFSRRCPVVSTHLGAFGYEVRHEQELLLANEPAKFAAACVTLIQNPALGVALAERAFAAFLKNWTWEAITPRVWAAAEDGLRHSAVQPERL